MDAGNGHLYCRYSLTEKQNPETLIMQDYFNSPIFVLGLPRSGTSMVAGAIGICGAWTGSTVPGGSPANPKGFFEHAVIREQVTKQVLIRLGYGPLGVRNLPPVDLQVEIPGLADTIRQVVEADGYANNMPWLYKDAKLTLLWPIFKKAFPRATWVVVRRDEEGFIDSCLRTGFMNQHARDRAFWKKFSDEYCVRIDALNNSDASVLEISSPDIIKGNFEPLEQLVSSLGLEYREAELKAFISPAYWHGDTGKPEHPDT